VKISFYSSLTGLFYSTVLEFADPPNVEALRAMTPDGHESIEGHFDCLCQRVDVFSGEVLDWQPPAPPDTEMMRWHWDTATRRWAGTPTNSYFRLEERQRAIEQMALLEAGQDRPMRELAIDPDDTAALLRLLQIEASMVALRDKLA
jgi:hypothetical protein